MSLSILGSPRLLSTRVQRRIRTLQGRTRHRLGLPVPRPGDAAIAAGFRHPVDASRRAILVATYLERFGESAAREIAEARRLKHHRITLLGHVMEHGQHITWSRDPRSGREWPRGYSPDIVYRGAERVGDVKLPWELGKHQYFFTLGKAAWLSDDASMALEIMGQIEHWIDDNPCNSGIHWISALEAGTRAVSWIMAYPFFADYCDAVFTRRFAVALAQHLQAVEQHLSIGAFANTHLIGEAAALVAGGLFLDCGRSARWIRAGLTILEEQARLQLADDAMHVERSVAYHRFFLDHYYLVAALLAANRRPFGPAVLDRVERMTAFLMQALFNDGTAPAFGDGDDARGIWVHADAPADYRGLLALGTLFFKRGDFKNAAAGVREEVLWLLGPEGIAAFDAVEPRRPDSTSAAYPESGYYVMRGGWDPDESVLAFDCGPVGFGPAGHGHADALSFQLHARRYPFLVDPGTFSYNIDYHWRDAFRGTRAHNTIAVDGKDQSEPGDRMSWKSVAHARPLAWVTTPFFDVVEGEHDGYRRLDDPVAHRRGIVFLKPDIWVIWDRLTGQERHHLELLFHLRPDCCAAIDAGENTFVLTSPDGARLLGWLAAEGVDAPGLAILTGHEGETAAWFSAGYGQKVPSRAVALKGRFSGECTLVTSLSTSECQKPIVTRPPGGVGVRVSRPGGVEDYFRYAAAGLGAPDVPGAMCDGTAFFQRTVRGHAIAVAAAGFQHIAVEGVVEVRSPAIVRSLVVVNGTCEIAIDPAHASRVEANVRDGLRLVINARPQLAASGRPDVSMVT